MSSNEELRELVWQDGQPLARGFPSQPKLVTASDSVSGNNNASSRKQQEKGSSSVAPPELCKSRFKFNNAFSEQCGGGNHGAISYDHTAIDKGSHRVVPVVHETRNTQHQDLPAESNPKPPSVVKKETTQMSKSSSESRPPAVNFSLFLRSPAPAAVPTNTVTAITSNGNLQHKEPPPPAPVAAAAVAAKSNDNNINTTSNGNLQHKEPPPPVAAAAAAAAAKSNDNTSNGSKNGGTGKGKEAAQSTSLFATGGPNHIRNLKRRCHDGYEAEESADSDQNEERPEGKAKILRWSSSSDSRNRSSSSSNNSLSLSSSSSSDFFGDGRKRSSMRRVRRIDRKVRQLQELIPDCDEMDESALILDEAIDYLRTLQLEVTMLMSMGTGICMPPMMLPTEMRQQIIQEAAAAAAAMPQMSHYPLTGVGMGMGMPPMGVGYYPAAQFQGLAVAGHHPTAVPGINQMPGFPVQPQQFLSMLLPLYMALMPQDSPPVSDVSQSASSTSMDFAPPANSTDSSPDVEVNTNNT